DLAMELHERVKEVLVGCTRVARFHGDTPAFVDFMIESIRSSCANTPSKSVFTTSKRASMRAVCVVTSSRTICLRARSSSPVSIGLVPRFQRGDTVVQNHDLLPDFD